jgi:uncharacterized membrane protein YeiH
VRSPFLLFDPAGLSLFAVAGAQKAIEFGLNPVTAAFLGMLTDVGGRTAHELFLMEIPQVLRSGLYAVAALAGASVVMIGDVLDLPYGASALAGAALCFDLRVMHHGCASTTVRRACARNRGLPRERIVKFDLAFANQPTARPRFVTDVDFGIVP